MIRSLTRKPEPRVASGLRPVPFLIIRHTPSSHCSFFLSLSRVSVYAIPSIVDSYTHLPFSSAFSCVADRPQCISRTIHPGETPTPRPGQLQSVQNIGPRCVHVRLASCTGHSLICSYTFNEQLFRGYY